MDKKSSPNSQVATNHKVEQSTPPTEHIKDKSTKKRTKKATPKKNKAKRKKATQKKKLKQQRARLALNVGGATYYLRKDPGRKKCLIPLSPSELTQQAAPKSRKDKLYGQGHQMGEIELGNKEEKKARKILKKASRKRRRKAFRALFSAPSIFTDAKTGWRFLLLCLIALVLDLAAPDLPGVPLVQLQNAVDIPKPLLAVLRALYGPNELKRRGAQIKRPSHLRAYISLGSYSPSVRMEDYLGGHIKVGGRKKSVWVPLSCEVFAVSPNTPESIWKTAITYSPLTIPILCSTIKAPVRPVLSFDVTSFQEYDPKMLKHLKSRSKLIFAELSDFRQWVHQKRKRWKHCAEEVEQFIPKTQNGRFISESMSAESTITAMALAVFKALLRYATEEKWVKQKKANKILQDAWRQLLPESAPPEKGRAANDASLAYDTPEVFYRFLTERFVPAYHSQILQALKGSQETMGLIRDFDDNGAKPWFITPRNLFLKAYAAWLGEASNSPAFGLSSKNSGAAIQRKLQDAGIPLRGETNNPATWRYTFYAAKEKKAKKEKCGILPCFALPLQELPEHVQACFRDQLGIAISVVDSPTGSEGRQNQSEAVNAL